MPLWPSEITRSTRWSPRSFRSENISSQVSSSSQSAILAPRISRIPSFLIPAITSRALLEYLIPSRILKYDASTRRYGICNSIGRERNSMTFESSSFATLETYEADIFSIPRCEITSSIFLVDTPWIYDSIIAFSSAFSILEYRSKTWVLNGISLNNGLFRLNCPCLVFRDRDLEPLRYVRLDPVLSYFPAPACSAASLCITSFRNQVIKFFIPS